MNASKVIDAGTDKVETVKDQLVVGSSLGGIDAVARDGIAEWLKSFVGVVEGFDDDGFELSGFEAGGEEGVDPSSIGREASAGRFYRGVESTEGTGGGDFTDDVLVVFDGETGVAAMGGVDQNAEEVGADLFIDSFDDIPGAADVGEGGEFHGAEELHVPGFDGRVGETGFFVDPLMSFEQLRQGGVIIGSGFGGSRIHPLLEGGGANGIDVQAFGNLENLHGQGDKLILVIRIHRIGPVDHEDGFGRDAQRLDACESLPEVLLLRSGKSEYGDDRERDRGVSQELF